MEQPQIYLSTNTITHLFELSQTIAESQSPVQPLATIIEEYAANNTFPHTLEPITYKLMKRAEQCLSRQQDHHHQPTTTIICPKCHPKSRNHNCTQFF